MDKFNFIYCVSKKLKCLKQIIFPLFSVLSGTRNREKETGFGDAWTVTVQTTVSIQAYCSVMHDWRNFNNVSLESTMLILYDNSMITVIHPTTWSQHTFVLGLFFLGRTVDHFLLYNHTMCTSFLFIKHLAVQLFTAFILKKKKKSFIPYTSF